MVGWYKAEFQDWKKMALWNQGVKEKYLTPVEWEILLCLLFTDKK